MAATEAMGEFPPLPDPNDAEFAPIRADLARLFMAHRLDLGLALGGDEWIVARTNDVTAALWFCRGMRWTTTTGTGCEGIAGGSGRRSGCTTTRPPPRSTAADEALSLHSPSMPKPKLPRSKLDLADAFGQ
jgi:hypothetical protein